jgi:hypothetical protein
MYNKRDYYIASVKGLSKFNFPVCRLDKTISRASPHKRHVHCLHCMLWQGDNLSTIITYLLRPRETERFVDPRPELLPEAKLRATTAVEGPQNTLLSRGLSK